LKKSKNCFFFLIYSQKTVSLLMFLKLAWLNQQFYHDRLCTGGSVAEWLACWTQAQKGLGWNRSRYAVWQQSQANCSHPSCLCSPNSEIGSSPLKGCGVTAGLAESNGSLPPGLWLTSPAGWLPRTGISSGTLRSVLEYGLPFSAMCSQCRS